MAAGEIGPWAEGDDKGATSSKTILGAIPYMAPESLSDFKTSDKPADIWSIAAIVYELLSGSKPFGRGPASIPKILVGTPPPRPTQISASQFKGLGGELYALITKCLAKNAADRPSADQLVSDCSELCYALDQYELGIISKNHNSYVGFIAETEGRDLMYHRDSFYGDATRRVGDQLWFGRHPGGNNDRAFPIVKIVTAKET
jgi:serine/threonine-protein kinase